MATFDWTFPQAFTENKRLEAPRQEFLFASNTDGVQGTVTGQHKTGEAITGGGGFAPTIQATEATLQSPLQAFGLTEPTAAVSGTGPVAFDAAVQRLGLSTFSGIVGYTVWAISGELIGQVTAENATDQTLTITTRASTETLANTLRPLKSDEGKVVLLSRDDGGFVAVDRADGGNTFQLEPPTRRRPLRQIGDYHVRRYEEELVSQSVEEWDVEIEFALDENRTDTPSANEGVNGAAFDWTFPQTFGRGEWGFTTRYGTLSTDRVDAEFVGRGEGGVRRFEITTRLTFDQAHVFEAALSRLGGVRVRNIPDATNVAVDETSGDVATLTIDSPNQETITDGEYVVFEWSSTRINDAFQRVEFVVGPAN